MEYEENAHLAKVAFLESLSRCESIVSREGNLRVNYLAELVGSGNDLANLH